VPGPVGLLAAVLLAALPAQKVPRPVAARQLASAFRVTDGRPRLVHLWASWCGPCREELPRLVAFLRRFSDEVDVVFIDLDEAARARQAARLLENAGGVPGLSLRAPPSVVERVIPEIDDGWQGEVPTTYLIGGDGRLLQVARGEAVLSDLGRAIQRALGGGPAPWWRTRRASAGD
jgi:thiol-disulfide isomerase/thioredoxin